MIVGGGFCGCWLADALGQLRPELALTIVDRDPKWAASTRNAGFVSSGNITEWLADSTAFGMAETERTILARLEGIDRIAALTPDEGLLDRCGSGDFCSPTQDKDRLMDRLNALLAKHGRAPHYERSTLQLGESTHPAYINRTDGGVDPVAVLSALQRRLHAREVPTLTGLDIVEARGGRATVRDDQGGTQSIEYRRAVLCTGAAASDLHPRTALQPTRGQILLSAPVHTPTSRVMGFLRDGYDYFRFVGDRVLVGGGRLDYLASEATDRLEPTETIRAYLATIMRNVVGHDDFVIDHHWAGIMGMRGHGHTSVSDLLEPVMLDAVTEEIAGFGGWGVTLSPYVAHRRAEEIARAF